MFNEQFFIIGFLVSMALLFVWFLLIVFAKKFMYEVHSNLFQIPAEDMGKIHYMLMGLFKLLVFLIFLVPYIVLKINT